MSDAMLYMRGRDARGRGVKDMVRRRDWGLSRR
jgi:hypothetical protein